MAYPKPPRTLTKKEFLELRPGGSYERYLRWLARVRPQRMAARRQAELDAWMEPWPERRIATQARRDVMPAVRAIMREVEASARRRGAAGMSAITGYTKELANSLMPFYASAGAIYDQAAGRQGALLSALPAALVGTGSHLAADLGAKLSQIDAPASQVAEVVGGTTQIGRGSGQATAALSSADLARLRAEQQANRAYAAAFPGIAGLHGATKARALQLALSRELTDALREIASRVPSQLVEATRAYRQMEIDKGLARLAMMQDKAELAAKMAKQEAESKAIKFAPEHVSRSAGVVMVYNERGEIVPWLRDGKPVKYTPPPRTSRKDKKKEEAAKREQARRDYFYEVREQTFRRAREYATPRPREGSVRPTSLPREEARARLWAEFGTQLVGRGFSKKAVMAMIDRALDAAYGKAPGSGSGLGSYGGR